MKDKIVVVGFGTRSMVAQKILAEIPNHEVAFIEKAADVNESLKIFERPQIPIINYQLPEPVKLPLTRKERRALSRKK